jgi:hypothetical protein
MRRAAVEKQEILPSEKNMCRALAYRATCRGLTLFLYKI